MPKDSYRSAAGYYDRLFENLTRGLRLRGVRMFAPREGLRVLDVGCGTGIHLDIYRRYGCGLFGIDASPAMLARARERLGPAAKLVLGDAAGMPYRDGAVDFAFSMFALHEMRPDARSRVLAEMKRVIKADGRILLIDFHPGPIQTLEGRLTKMLIFLVEASAGREHFRNYRNFMALKGLPALIEANGLGIEKEGLVRGGALALFLLRKA